MNELFEQRLRHCERILLNDLSYQKYFQFLREDLYEAVELALTTGKLVVMGTPVNTPWGTC